MFVFVRTLLIFIALFMCVNTSLALSASHYQLSSSAITLTETEAEWLAKNSSISLGFPYGYEPYLISDSKGNLSGFMVDFLKILNKRLGTDIKLVGATLPDLLARVNSNELDGILAMHVDYSSKLGLLPSHGYIEVYPTLFSRRGLNVKSPDDLAGKKVVYRAKEYYSQEIFDKYGKKSTAEKVNSALEGFSKIDNGEADVFIGLSGNTYLISKYHFSGLIPKYVFLNDPQKFGMGIRPDWPIFQTIINKGIASFSNYEIDSLMANWVGRYSEETGLSQITLSKEEKAWLKENPIIRFSNELDWEPFDFAEKGEPKGYSVDYIRLLEKKIPNIRFEFVDGYSWVELVEMLKNRDIDVLHCAAELEKRKTYTLFTAPYIHLLSGIATRTDRTDIYSVEDLNGKRLGVIKGYIVEDLLKKYYPEIKPVFFNTPVDAIMAVSAGKVDAYIDKAPSIQYLINKYLIKNVHVSGNGDLDPENPPKPLRMGVRKDWPLLRGILDKALESVTPEEKLALKEKWFGVETQRVASFVLSAKEQEWLTRNPEIKIGVMNAWPPMDFVDEAGKPSGIGADYLHLLNKRLGGRIRIESGSWEEIVNKVKKKKLDGITSITPTPEREKFFNFTRPYIKIPHVIVARKDGPYHSNLEDLSHKTVALEKGFFLKSVIEQNNSNIVVREFHTTSDALNAVDRGDADAYLGNRAVAAYTIDMQLLNSLQVQGVLKDTASINAIGVRKDWPELSSILDNALASLSPKEERELRNKWGGSSINSIDLSELGLNNEERVFLKSHPVIHVGVDKSWKPVEFLDQKGNLKGISMDYLHKIEQILGIQFQFHDDVSWYEALDLLRQRKLDMLSAAVETDDRKTVARFTEPYLSLPTAVFTKDIPVYIGNLKELSGKKVVVVKDHAIGEYLKTNYPNIKLVEANNVKEGLEWLGSGEAFAYVGNILVTGHYIREYGYTNLKISGDSEFRDEIAFAARSDWPLLTSALQKAINSMSETERNSIYRNWVAITYEKRIEYSGLWRYFALSVLVILLILFWNRRMANEVRERRQTELRLLESEKRIQAILDSINAGLVIIDPQNRLIDEINPTAAAMIGLSQEQIVGSSCHQFLYPDVQPGQPIDDHENPVKNCERKLLLKTGREVAILKTVVPINLDGKPKILESFVDLSTQKEVEKTLQQKLEELERFFKLTVNREEKMISLKAEVNSLRTALGKREKYKVR